ncbi:MAG: 3D domain-containing protein, partial [Acidaminobacteraceae bacterium]
VVVIDKGININVKTTSRTVGSMLRDADIKLNEKDKLSISENTKLEDDMRIIITRSKPFTINMDGELIAGATTYKLISEVLKEYNVELGEFDMVTPSINSIINRGDIINITRVEKELISAEEVITYSTIIKMVKDLNPGEIKKVSNGKDGLKKVTYELVKEDGSEISRYIVDKEIRIESESEIIEKGIDKLYVTSRGKPFRYKETIYMQSTAYDLSVESCGKLPGDAGYGITYSGTKARPGVIAVDPKVIPLGSKVYVESTDETSDYGFAIAEDTGGAIKGNRVDIFIGDRSRALRYGRRNVRIYVIEDPVDSKLIKGYGK